MKKKILVACGQALVSSKVVSQKIMHMAAQENLSVHTREVKASEIDEAIAEFAPDIIVCTCEVKNAGDIPVLNGRAFLTGINLGKTAKQLIELLKED